MKVIMNVRFVYITALRAYRYGAGCVGHGLGPLSIRRFFGGYLYENRNFAY
jgi:hypothetical protein